MSPVNTASTRSNVVRVRKRRCRCSGAPVKRVSRQPHSISASHQGTRAISRPKEEHISVLVFRIMRYVILAQAYIQLMIKTQRTGELFRGDSLLASCTVLYGVCMYVRTYSPYGRRSLRSSESHPKKMTEASSSEF